MRHPVAAYYRIIAGFMLFADTRKRQKPRVSPRLRQSTALQRPGVAAERFLLLAGLRVTTTELVDATTQVERFVLAGVERMRMAGNVHFDQRILVAILPL